MPVTRASNGRLGGLSRVLACTIGAYGLTALATTAGSILLVRAGIDRIEAVTGTTIASFALFAVISMAACHAVSTPKTWRAMALAALVLAPMLLLARPE